MECDEVNKQIAQSKGELWTDGVVVREDSSSGQQKQDGEGLFLSYPALLKIKSLKEYGVHLSAGNNTTTTNQKLVIPLKQELQATVHCLMRMLRTNLGYYDS